MEVRAPASDYNSRHATLWAEATYSGAIVGTVVVVSAVCRFQSLTTFVLKLIFNDLVFFFLVTGDLVCKNTKGGIS